MATSFYQQFSFSTQKAVEAALLAGKILKTGFGSSFQISCKEEGRHNLVTEYDHASEKMLLHFFQKHFPQDTILSEESGLKSSSSQRRWIVDPLDGTVNFAHGIPFFSVSIALQEEDKTLTGVVYQPITEELFVAEKGKGSYLNEEKLQVSSNTSLAESFLSTGFPYNLADNPHHCIERFIKLLQQGIPIRRLGSAALDLSYVAAGRFDGFFEVSLAPWDCAAGVLIVEEAKGKITEWSGAPFLLDSYHPILATNAHIHSDLSSVLSEPL